MSCDKRFLDALFERLSFRVNKPKLVTSAASASLLTWRERRDLGGGLERDPHAFLLAVVAPAFAFLHLVEEVAFFPPGLRLVEGALGCLGRLPHAAAVFLLSDPDSLVLGVLLVPLCSVSPWLPLGLGSPRLPGLFLILVGRYVLRLAWTWSRDSLLFSRDWCCPRELP